MREALIILPRGLKPHNPRNQHPKGTNPMLKLIPVVCATILVTLFAHIGADINHAYAIMQGQAQPHNNNNILAVKWHRTGG